MCWIYRSILLWPWCKLIKTQMTVTKPDGGSKETDKGVAEDLVTAKIVTLLQDRSFELCWMTMYGVMKGWVHLNACHCFLEKLLGFMTGGSFRVLLVIHDHNFQNYAHFLSMKFKLECCRGFSPICSSSFYPPHLFGLMQGTEQAIICQELIFWFPHSATVADQHLMGRAESEP